MQQNRHFVVQSYLERVTKVFVDFRAVMKCLGFKLPPCNDGHQLQKWLNYLSTILHKISI